MDEEGYITPVHVRDYVFCPTIFYLKHVLGLPEPVTDAMEEGLREFCRDSEGWRYRKTLLSQRRIKVDRAVFGQPVTSERYRMRGVVDTLYWEGRRLNVLEIKAGRQPRMFPAHLYQASSYALMAEEEFGQTVYRVIVFYKGSGLWCEKRFTDQLREYTARLVEKVHRAMEGGEVPEPRWTAKCAGCFYRRHCY